MEVFKFYRKGKGKRPANKVDIFLYEDAEKNEDFGGILKDDIVDISFDDKNLYETMLDIIEANDLRCLAMSSPHGGHTYWKLNDHIKKDGQDIILSCGVKADIHHKGTYIPLRESGILREIDYDILEGEEYEEVPYFLYPTKSKTDLWQLKNGDGRNSALSKHVFSLSSFSESQIKSLFNEIINTYILYDKLDSNELDTILRPETFEKMQALSVFDEDGKFKHRLMANALLQDNKIVDYKGQIYIYNNETNMYESAVKSFHHKMIDIYPDIADRQRTEVYKYLLYTSPEKEQADKRYISFNNGIYDLETRQLLPHSSDYLITNQIPWNYNEKAYDKTMDMMLDKITCNRKDLRQLLEECVGYCFYRSVKMKKCFIFTGGKNNGKSTFIFALNNLLGEDNYTCADIADFKNEYHIASLQDKLANIKDDIADGYFDGVSVSLFKQLVAGNKLRGRAPYGTPFDFYPYSTLIFSANAIPKMKDNIGGAVIDRMLIIPFDAVFDKKDKDFDPNISDKLCTQSAMEYLLILGVNALHKVLVNREFTEPDCVREKTKEYKTENDSVLFFISEIGEDAIINQSVKDVHTRYTIFCNDNNFKPVGTIKMSKIIRTELNLPDTKTAKINGTCVKIFIKNL